MSIAEKTDNTETEKAPKEKSLGFLSNGFIRLFIKTKKMMSLEQAAVLLSNSDEDHKLKTKVFSIDSDPQTV